MAISFKDVPSNLRVPFVTCEFDTSKASQGPALLAYRALLIGQKLSTGTAASNSLHRVTSVAQVIELAGRGSQLHRMAKAWFTVNTSTEVWIGVLEDATAGVAASAPITVTAGATAAGTINLYLGGETVKVAVAAGDTTSVIASAIKDAIDDAADLPVTASVNAAIVTVLQRNKGEAGNSFDMRANYQVGQKLPAGVGLTFGSMSGGTTNPTLTTLIATLGDTWFHIWAHPYTDATSLTALETELKSRNGPLRMIDGLGITSAIGTQATLATLGESRNCQHSVIVAQPGKNPVIPPAEVAAGVAGVVAYYGADDPARPFQTLEVAGLLAPAEADQFTLQERNLLLYDGIATTRATVDGAVQLDRIITTYQTNSAGADDTAYLDATSLLTLMYLRYSWRTRVANRYPRHKVADDGTRFGAGQAVVTPKIMKAEACAWFREMEDLGLVENFDQFKNDLVVERNGSDPNRIDVLLPPDLINRLIVTASVVQFRL